MHRTCKPGESITIFKKSKFPPPPHPPPVSNYLCKDGNCIQDINGNMNLNDCISLCRKNNCPDYPTGEIPDNICNGKGLCTNKQMLCTEADPSNCYWYEPKKGATNSFCQKQPSDSSCTTIPITFYWKNPKTNQFELLETGFNNNIDVINGTYIGKNDGLIWDWDECDIYLMKKQDGPTITGFFHSALVLKLTIKNKVRWYIFSQLEQIGSDYGFASQTAGLFPKLGTDGKPNWSRSTLLSGEGSPVGGKSPFENSESLQCCGFFKESPTMDTNKTLKEIDLIYGINLELKLYSSKVQGKDRIKCKLTELNYFLRDLQNNYRNVYTIFGLDIKSLKTDATRPALSQNITTNNTCESHASLMVTKLYNLMDRENFEQPLVTEVLSGNLTIFPPQYQLTLKQIFYVENPSWVFPIESNKLSQYTWEELEVQRGLMSPVWTEFTDFYNEFYKLINDDLPNCENDQKGILNFLKCFYKALVDEKITYDLEHFWVYSYNNYASPITFNNYTNYSVQSNGCDTEPVYYKIDLTGLPVTEILIEILETLIGSLATYENYFPIVNQEYLSTCEITLKSTSAVGKTKKCPKILV